MLILYSTSYLHIADYDGKHALSHCEYLFYLQFNYTNEEMHTFEMCKMNQ